MRDGQVCIADVTFTNPPRGVSWPSKPKATYLPTPGGGLGAVKSYLPTFCRVRSMATLHSVVDAHGAQAILGKIKRTKEHQNNGNAGSFKFAAGQQWLQPTGCPIQHRVRNQPHSEKLRRQPHRLRWRATSHSNSNYFRSYMETIKLT